MRHGARLWKSLFAAGLLAALGAPVARAQTYPAATCPPGRANAAAATVTAFSMGILHVALGSINNTALGQDDPYQERNCFTLSPTTATTRTGGQAYPLTVRAPAATTRRCWPGWTAATTARSTRGPWPAPAAPARVK